MSNKGKAPMVPTQSKKRGYVSWTKQMDETMIGVMYNQLKEGNKGDGEWKPQAYQAVADELRTTFGTFVTTDNVKNRMKSWKKHYAVITDIRTLSKFKWDDERKMIVIAIEDVEQWIAFVEQRPHETKNTRTTFACKPVWLKVHPSAAPYRNKFIDYWDDICALCGGDRALGDGVEMHDEAATTMEEEIESGDSSSKGRSSSAPKKQKRDRLADAMTKFTDCFSDYIQSKPKEIVKPTPIEVHDIVKNVIGIGRHQVMKVVIKLLNGPISDFEMLKSLPDDDKLDWVLLCLDDE